MTGFALFNNDLRSATTSFVIPRPSSADGTLLCALAWSFSDETSILELLSTTMKFGKELLSKSISGDDDTKSDLESHMTS